jgi:glucokinase
VFRERVDLALRRGSSSQSTRSEIISRRQLMERIPVHVILTRAALVGAATCGLESFKEES